MRTEASRKSCPRQKKGRAPEEPGGIAIAVGLRLGRLVPVASCMPVSVAVRMSMTPMDVAMANATAMAMMSVPVPAVPVPAVAMPMTDLFDYSSFRGRVGNCRLR